MGTVRYTTIDGEIVAERRNGVRKTYVPDSLGSTLALTDAGQTVASTFRYWPYGEERVVTGSPQTELRFGGVLGYRRSSTRQYVRARSYQPRLGRWLSIDPISSEEAYAYVGGNPITYSDYSGLSSGIIDRDPAPIINRPCYGEEARACASFCPKSTTAICFPPTPPAVAPLCICWPNGIGKNHPGVKPKKGHPEGYRPIYPIPCGPEGARPVCLPIPQPGQLPADDDSVRRVVIRVGGTLVVIYVVVRTILRVTCPWTNFVPAP
jgi:RHS repeat-associated protein